LTIKVVSHPTFAYISRLQVEYSCHFFGEIGLSSLSVFWFLYLYTAIHFPLVLIGTCCFIDSFDCHSGCFVILLNDPLLRRRVSLLVPLLEARFGIST